MLEWLGLLVDNLYFVVVIYGIRGKENEDEVDFIIWWFGLDKYRNVIWNEIFGGFKMWFLLGRVLVYNFWFLILDEFLVNFDVNI